MILGRVLHQLFQVNMRLDYSLSVHICCLFPWIIYLFINLSVTKGWSCQEYMISSGNRRKMTNQFGNMTKTDPNIQYQIKTVSTGP